MKDMKKLMAPGGALGVFAEYPLLGRFAAICLCAEIAWAILIAVLQFHFSEDLFPDAGKQLIASRIATITLAFVGCETLFKIPMGALADKIGPRRVVFFALIVAAISPILMTQATQWWHFVPLRALDGLGAAALWPSMSSLMARSVPREAKAAAMSVFNGAYCLGLAIGPMVGLAIGHKFGNVKVFPICAALLLLGLAIAWSVLRNGVGDKVETVNPNKGVLSDDANTMGEDFPSQSGSVLRGRPLLVRMMFLYALSQAAVGLFAVVAVPYIDHQFHIKEGDLPKLIALPALAIAVLALPLGRMGDSIGRAKAVWISYAMATFGMLLVALTSLMTPSSSLLSPPLMLWSVGLLLLSGSYILGTPAWLGLTSLQVDDARQGQTLSMMQTAQGVGIVVASAVVASAGNLLTRWDLVRASLHERFPRLPHIRLPFRPRSEEPLVFRAHDVIPITLWLWLSLALFALCLVGVLLWVHEPPHSPEAEENAKGDKQPLELSGV